VKRRETTRLDGLPTRKADFIEPMECALVSKLPEGSDWTYEVKLDGYRAIGVRTSRETILYSRNHKNFNKRFPQIADALNDLPAETVIDGEVVALDESGRPEPARQVACLFGCTGNASETWRDFKQLLGSCCNIIR